MALSQSETDIGVQVVHTVSGEDYLGHIYRDLETGAYLIERPIVVMMNADATGRIQVVPMPLRPYLQTVEQLDLAKEHVMWVKPVNEQLELIWRRATSDLILPTISVPEIA
jgi:hypothetical protein